MLQMTTGQLDSYALPNNVQSLLSIVKPILVHRCVLYERYARKSNPVQLMHGCDCEGKKQAIVAFEYYIVNMVKGYLGGKAPMYTVSSPSDYASSSRHSSFWSKLLSKTSAKADTEEKNQYVVNYTEAIDYIRRYNDDAATYIELLHDYLITAAAYLYIYENKNNEIVYTRFDSRQTVAIYDYSTPANHIGTVRTWLQKDVRGEDIDVVEIITNNKRVVFHNDKLISEEKLAWDDVPCVAFENPDNIAIFEPAVSMIDVYEQLTNNICNMTRYNDNAKLLVRGYSPEYEAGTPEREEEESAWLNGRTLFIGDDSGDVEWLIKEVNYSGILETLKSYHDKITMLTGVPNMTDEAFSNADNASALGYKLYALDQYSATADRVFKKGFLRLWEIITNRLNIKGGNFDFRDIDIVMARNIPTDKDKSLERALRAYQGGLLGQEDALNESQLDIDAKDAMRRQQAEEDEDYMRTYARNEQEESIEDELVNE